MNRFEQLPNWSDGFGRLVVLINNLGITGPVREIQEYDATDAAAVLMTNVVGYVRMIHASCLGWSWLAIPASSFSPAASARSPSRTTQAESSRPRACQNCPIPAHNNIACYEGVLRRVE